MVVLDTHAWLWWVSDPGRLGARAREAIEQSETVGVPAVCCWEVGMLERRGRIALDREVARWVRQALARPGIVALPLTPQIALAAALLDGEAFAGDPADRLIYATARAEGAPLLSRDRRIADFDPRGTLW